MVAEGIFTYELDGSEHLCLFWEQIYLMFLNVVVVWIKQAIGFS